MGEKLKITLCGSIAFYDEMLKVKEQLESRGHEIRLPPIETKDENGNMIPIKKYYELRKSDSGDTKWIWDRKEEAMRIHFDKIEWSDAVLITNYDKNAIKGYVGANTLMEMGLAFHLHKKIFLLNEIPDQSCKEEIIGMKPILMDGDLNKIEE